MTQPRKAPHAYPSDTMTHPARRVSNPAKLRWLRIAAIMSLVALTMVESPARAYSRPGVTERISTTSSGRASVLHVELPGVRQPRGSISADGRFIAFESDAADLVLGDTNGVRDIFLKDRKTGKIVIASVTSQGISGTGQCVSVKNPGVAVGSFLPSISRNGRYVTFASCAADLVTGDTNRAMDVFVYDARTTRVRRASVSSSGEQASHSDPTEYPGSWPGAPAGVSNDGRFVAFESNADNLVKDDTNAWTDVFVHDFEHSRTERVSVSSTGEQGERASGAGPQWALKDTSSVSITPDGRYVAFFSLARNLVENDNETSGADIFLHDRRTRKTELISVASDGSQPQLSSNVLSEAPAMSKDARFIAFTSSSSAFVPNDREFLPASDEDVFVRDRKANRTERVSISWTGAESHSTVIAPGSGGRARGGLVQFSDDGRYITFTSNGNGYVPEDDGPPSGQTGGSSPKTYVHDRLTGATELADPATLREEDGAAHGSTPGDLPGMVNLSQGLSGNGRFVLFESQERIIEEKDNGLSDFYVRDRGLSVGTGGLPGASVDVAGAPKFPRDGFARRTDPVGDVAAGTLALRSADVIQATLAYRPQYRDLRLRLDVDKLLPTLPGLAHPSIMYGFRFSLAGMEHEVRIQRTLSGAVTAGGADFGLFRCATPTLPCTLVATLQGGYGTTGESVVVALPIEALGTTRDIRLDDVEGFSAAGSYDLGPLQLFDRVALSSPVKKR